MAPTTVDLGTRTYERTALDRPGDVFEESRKRDYLALRVENYRRALEAQEGRPITAHAVYRQTPDWIECECTYT